MEFEVVQGDLHWAYRGGTLVVRSKAVPKVVYGHWVVDTGKVGTVVDVAFGLWSDAILRSVISTSAPIFIGTLTQPHGLMSMIFSGGAVVAQYFPGDPLASLITAEEVHERISTKTGFFVDVLSPSDVIKHLSPHP